MKKLILFLFVLLFVLSNVQAQFQDSLLVQLVKDWQRSKNYTLSYLQVMPANKYSFKPQDSIRTFSQQMIHLAQGTISLMQAATEEKVPPIINRSDLENTQSALGKDSVVYFVTLSYDYAINALKKMNLNRAFEYSKRGKFNETRLAWAFKAYEHQAHHRGQTTIYIRSAGIKPPNELLFDNMYQ